MAETFPPLKREEEFIPKANNKKRGYVKGQPFIKVKYEDFNPSSRRHIAERLKLKYVESLLLIDAANEDPEKELPYSKDNCETLVQNSNEFDTWLNEVVFDLDNFRKEPTTGSDKPTGKTVQKS